MNPAGFRGRFKGELERERAEGLVDGAWSCCRVRMSRVVELGGPGWRIPSYLASRETNASFKGERRDKRCAVWRDRVGRDGRRHRERDTAERNREKKTAGPGVPGFSTNAIKARAIILRIINIGM